MEKIYAKITSQDHVIESHKEQLEGMMDDNDRLERNIISTLREIQKAKGIKAELCKKIAELEGKNGG